MSEPTKIRIGTFNVENLFARFKFKANEGKKEDTYLSNGWTINETAFEVTNPEERRFTANAIRDLDADVLALQEVENLNILKRFNNGYLKELGYSYFALISGNDPRFINIAVLSRYPIVHIRSHQHCRRPDSKSLIFSRDCLEVDVFLPGEKTFTLYINHFKSMLGGREATMEKRKLQTETVVKIINARFDKNINKKAFVVLGDFNDYRDGDNASPGLAPLLKQEWLSDAVMRLPANERWTHFYKGTKEYNQLDYILLSKAIADSNIDSKPIIIRKGQPLRAGNYNQYAGIGQDKPKASDHCPVGIDIKLNTI
ncbi:MAG: endonuclease/exonuclease/phosphatase family protein [bacterium]|nr:endonuclease/exonuclease/phosphatase family protein [bacterium]